MGRGGARVHRPVVRQDHFTLVEDRNEGTMVCEYDDCKLTELVVTAQNRGVATYTASWQGLSCVYGGASIGPATETDLPLAWPQVTVTRAGIHKGTCNSINLTINRN